MGLRDFLLQSVSFLNRKDVTLQLGKIYLYSRLLVELMFQNLARLLSSSYENASAENQRNCELRFPRKLYFIKEEQTNKQTPFTLYDTDWQTHKSLSFTHYIANHTSTQSQNTRTRTHTLKGLSLFLYKHVLKHRHTQTRTHIHIRIFKHTHIETLSPSQTQIQDTQKQTYNAFIFNRILWEPHKVLDEFAFRQI